MNFIEWFLEYFPPNILLFYNPFYVGFSLLILHYTGIPEYRRNLSKGILYTSTANLLLVYADYIASIIILHRLSFCLAGFNLPNYLLYLALIVESLPTFLKVGLRYVKMNFKTFLTGGYKTLEREKLLTFMTISFFWVPLLIIFILIGI